jgi:hypothetical protein
MNVGSEVYRSKERCGARCVRVSLILTTSCRKDQKFNSKIRILQSSKAEKESRNEFEKKERKEEW